MRAVVQDRYGSVDDLRVREIDRPAAGPGEVLVRVHAASVHPDVWHVVTGRPYLLRLMGSGLRRPKYRVPGTDLAGVVEQAGPGATRFRPGDEVFGETLLGFSWRNGGAFAEYAAVPEEVLAAKPAAVTFEQAATVPTAGYIALVNIPADRLRPGARVLVNGAGGGVGGLTVQLAKANGAHVTAVDHTAKLDLLRTLGADEVIDYTRTDFTRDDRRYDLIVDIPGNHSFRQVRRVLTPDGLYVLIGHDRFGDAGHRWLGSVPRFAKLAGQSLFSRHLRSATAAGLSKKDAIATLAEHLAAGRLTPVIARAYPLDEVVPALRHLTGGEPLGRIVLTARQ